MDIFIAIFLSMAMKAAAFGDAIAAAENENLWSRDHWGPPILRPWEGGEPWVTDSALVPRRFLAQENPGSEYVDCQLSFSWDVHVKGQDARKTSSVIRRVIVQKTSVEGGRIKATKRQPKKDDEEEEPIENNCKKKKFRDATVTNTYTVTASDEDEAQEVEDLLQEMREADLPANLKDYWKLKVCGIVISEVVKESVCERRKGVEGDEMEREAAPKTNPNANAFEYLQSLLSQNRLQSKPVHNRDGSAP